MRNKVLVVGASPLQVPLIYKLNNLGFITFSISNRPNDPGLTISSKGMNISILDFESIEKLFIDEQMDFAITCGSDLGSYTVAHLNAKFNLTGSNTAQLINVTHKGNFNNILKKLNLNHVPFVTLSQNSDLNSIINTIEIFPVVLKPFFSSGSRGVSIVNSKEEILEKLPSTIKSSSIFKGCVIQNYIEGNEVGAECLIEDYNVVFLEFTSKKKNEFMVPIGHFIPNVLGEITRLQVKDQIESIVTHLGIKNSPANLDIIIDNSGTPYIIDLSFRLGGNMLPDLMKEKYGIDPYFRIIEYMLDQKPESIKCVTKPGNFGSIIFNSNTDGILTNQKIVGIKELFNKQRIYNVVFDISKDVYYEKFTEGSKRFGHAIGKFDCLEHFQVCFSKFHEIINKV